MAGPKRIMANCRNEATIGRGQCGEENRQAATARGPGGGVAEGRGGRGVVMAVVVFPSLPSASSPLGGACPQLPRLWCKYRSPVKKNRSSTERRALLHFCILLPLFWCHLPSPVSVGPHSLCFGRLFGAPRIF